VNAVPTDAPPENARQHSSYLVVDDNEVFAQTLARTLEQQGLSASVAHDEATAYRQNTEQRPARIILDLKLADTSGLGLISRLKRDNPSTEIVILTGYSSINTAVEAIKLGAKNYLCKPAGIGEILNAFEREAGNPDIALAEEPPSVDRLEWEHIQRVLAEHDGNISATARALGMHRRTLQRKLQKRPRRK